MKINSTGIFPIMAPQKPACTHDENCPDDAKNMPGHRHRNKDGTLRKKSGATHLSTLEEERGEFSRLPGPTHLSELRERTGETGINKVASALKAQEDVCKGRGVDVRA